MSAPVQSELEAVLTVVSILIEDVAEDPSRAKRAMEIARRDIPALFPKSASHEANCEAVLAALVHLEQAYANSHSPTHRSSALRHARSVIQEHSHKYVQHEASK